MLPKNCDQCHHLFVPQPSGLRAVFCKACYIQCEQAYLEIRRYLQEHPKASAAKIAIETGVPTAFIYHLFRNGRFMVGLPFGRSSLSTEQRGLCTQCGKLLSVFFDALCDECEDHRLQTISPPPQSMDGTASSFAPSRRVSSRRRREKSQYGFNRSR